MKATSWPSVGPNHNADLGHLRHLLASAGATSDLQVQVEQPDGTIRLARVRSVVRSRHPNNRPIVILHVQETDEEAQHGSVEA